jgi:hypothetical protein
VYDASDAVQESVSDACISFMHHAQTQACMNHACLRLWKLSDFTMLQPHMHDTFCITRTHFICRMFKNNLFFRWLKFIQMHRASIAILAQYRSYIQRKKYSAVHRACLAIQSCWRGKVVRQQIWAVSTFAFASIFSKIDFVLVSSRAESYYCAKIRSRIFG